MALERTETNSQVRRLRTSSIFGLTAGSSCQHCSSSFQRLSSRPRAAISGSVGRRGRSPCCIRISTSGVRLICEKGCSPVINCGFKVSKVAKEKGAVGIDVPRAQSSHTRRHQRQWTGYQEHSTAPAQTTDKSQKRHDFA